MSEERYAAFEHATAMTVVKCGSAWWTQVRPYLYRPLLPFKKYDSKRSNRNSTESAVISIVCKMEKCTIPT